MVRPLVLVSVLLLACGDSAPEAPGELAVGATRTDLIARHGPPVRQETLVKQEEAIWGPIETFWSSVPMGSTVELWAYPSTLPGSGEPCEIELYFVDGSDEVKGTGVYVEGVVYESG
jgi:hypothetical protein